MPTRMQAAVASLDNDILRVLVTYTNDAPRDRLASTAATTTNWRRADAATEFLNKIATATPPTALTTQTTTPGRAPQLER